MLDASPWVVPRPLYVLATQQAGREAGLTYTLRTRVGRPELEDELTQLLGGRRRPDGTPLIRYGDVVDGVVAFESEDEAQRFGELVEAEGAAEVGGALAWWFEVGVGHCAVLGGLAPAGICA